jgi:glycosyltransferase involved in cell wall biosynthesis
MKVSIITPSLNQGRFIERTIQSVLSQHIDNLEYIIIDGGSQDQTLEILNQYKNRLKFISEPDDGQSDAINKGLKMASGDIIGWLNSDDIYYPDAIKSICSFFQKHPEIDIVYGQAYHIDAHDQIIAPYPTQPWHFKQLFNHCYISQPAVFFRKTVIERYGLLNKTLNYCMDFEYWLRLGKKGAKFAYFPQLLAGSRVYPETKTASQAVKMQKEVITMLKHNFHKVHPRWFLTYAYADTKSTLKFSIFNLLFFIKMYHVACQTALETNGWMRGIINIFCFPSTLFILLLKKLNRSVKYV